MEVLMKGSTGEEVKILQEKLENLGYYNGIITGSFGSATLEAVLSFQENNGLLMDGIVDQEMWDLLFYQTQPKAKTYVIEPILTYGQSGDDVRVLQKQLKGTLYYNNLITGVFDKKTLEAVKQFQYNNHITTDGIVGDITWAALNSSYAIIADCALEGEPEIEGDYYIVKPGDTLYSIARHYGITVEELKALNNLSSNIISVGQKLRVPKNEDIITDEFYTVKPGDTLYSIARKFGLTVTELKKLNNLTSDIISINQVLLIKEKNNDNNNTNYNYYIVQPGDTLYSIALKYLTTVDELKKLNNLSSNILLIGQQLLIPTRTYIVKAGDTLYSIARNFGLTVDELKSKNNLYSNIISIGQILKV